MSFIDKLEKIVAKFQVLDQKMSDPEVLSSAEYPKVAKERADLEPVVLKAREYQNTIKQIDDCKALISDKDTDSEMKEMAELELEDNKTKLESLEKDIKIALIPKDAADSKNAIIEVRAGTGGDEAALFAAQLLRMYQKYAERMGWKFEMLTLSETGLDGYKEASAVISGKDVFSKLKFESGVHRVQRVPQTESSGRIHTSAATVAVLPEAEEVDVKLNEADLRIDVYRSSGAGGQHVNTTDSAVRITHLPTGLVVSMQDEKSQHKNRQKAMKILVSRLYEQEREKLNSERSAMRKNQVGSGDRSERIRTYNFPQGRVTDHRINVTLYNLDKFINEGEMDEIIIALIEQDQIDKLAETEV